MIGSSFRYRSTSTASAEADSEYELHVDDTVLGREYQDDSFGVIAENTHHSGSGLLALGNHNARPFHLVEGAGVESYANFWGVYGMATIEDGYNRAGGYFGIYDGGFPGEVWAKVAYKTNSGNIYNIQGTGSVSTVISTSQGQRALICPESPEAWFEDYGTGVMVNGRGRVDLDPMLLDGVTVDAENPLMVFVQMTSPLPNGHYVLKDYTGFTVVEQNDGGSRATFDYRIVAKRAGWENVRFDIVAPPPARAELNR